MACNDVDVLEKAKVHKSFGDAIKTKALLSELQEGSETKRPYPPGKDGPKKSNHRSQKK